MKPYNKSARKCLGESTMSFLRVPLEGVPVTLLEDVTKRQSPRAKKLEFSSVHCESEEWQRVAKSGKEAE